MWSKAQEKAALKAAKEAQAAIERAIAAYQAAEFSPDFMVSLNEALAETKHSVRELEGCL